MVYCIRSILEAQRAKYKYLRGTLERVKNQKADKNNLQFKVVVIFVARLFCGSFQMLQAAALKCNCGKPVVNTALNVFAQG